MLDSQIVSVLIAQIKVQLGIYGIAESDLRVSRSHQPTRQKSGAATGAKPYQVFIYPITNTDIGWRRKYTDGGTFDRTITHTKQKTYQISTLTQFSQGGSVIPAHDLAQIVHDMLQHPDSTSAMRDSGVYLHECQSVRPAFQVSERDQWESMPNFDIVLSYNSEYTKTVPVVDDVTGEWFPV